MTKEPHDAVVKEKAKLLALGYPLPKTWRTRPNPGWKWRRRYYSAGRQSAPKGFLVHSRRQPGNEANGQSGQSAPDANFAIGAKA